MAKRAINEYTDGDGRKRRVWRYTDKDGKFHTMYASFYISEATGGYTPEPVTPDGRLAVDVFAEWAREFASANRYLTHDDENYVVPVWVRVEIEHKLRELHLLPEPKPEPTIEERLAAAEKLIMFLQAKLEAECISRMDG